MLPRNFIDRINTDSWGGIVDGIYAIILTLLTIELPVQILSILDRLIDSAHGQTANVILGAIRPELRFTIFNLMAGYFAVFIILFDIWSSHRAIIGVSGRMHSRAILTSWTLFLSTLIPSLHYVVNSVREKYFLTGAIENSPVALELHITRAIEYPVIAVVYFFLILQAATDLAYLKGVNTPADEKDALKFISRTSLTKSILSIIIFLGVNYISSINHNLKILWEAPVVLITIALLTYFNVDLFRWAPRSR